MTLTEKERGYWLELEAEFGPIQPESTLKGER